MKVKKKIDVIVIAYNEEENISKCIDSLLTQSITNFNLVLINDGSNDKTHEIIKRYKDSRIIYVQSKNRKGYSLARNIGVKKSDSDIIFFIDADCEAEKDWLKTGYETYNKNIIGVGGLTYKINNNFKKSIHSSHDFKGAAFSTCNVSYQTKFLKKIKGFSNRYNEGSEDSDLFIRIQKFGEVVKNKNMTVYHHNKEKDLKKITILLKRVKTLVFLLKDYEEYLKSKKNREYIFNKSNKINEIYLKIGNLWIIKPFFLYCVFFPPLIILYLKENKIKINTLRSVISIFLIYGYMILVRLIVWKTAIKERYFVI